MKLVKSLLLGSAAGLFAVAGAQAADLPVRKAAPVDYVRVCSTYGTGYWFIPGTDTCMRISGFVRADYLYLEPFRRDFDATGFRARGRLNFDFRQPTEYGLLRAFIRYEITRNTGTFVAAGRGAVDASGVFFGTGPTSTADIPLAYVQFGGFTAGRVQSFYDFWANDDLFTTLLSVSDLKTQTLAYTATFGGGWSATIAIEDPQERRKTAAPLDTSFTGFGLVAVDPTALAPQAFAPAGTRAPDVVANIRIDQSWGAAQLSAAAHELRASNIVGRTGAGGFFVSLPGAVPAGATPLDNPDNEWGYAIQGGVRFNLPMIAAGDQLWLQAAYASGALGYTNIDNFTAARAGTFRLNQDEAVINPFTGDIERTDSWSVSGKFLHYWLPNLRSNIFGAYSEIDYDPVASRAFITPEGVIVNAGFVDLRIYEAGANLIWSPVKGLDIGVEGIYRKFETKGNVAPEFGPVNFATGRGDRDVRFGSRDTQDAWEARLRVQRDF
jgi:hypothetical protein